MTGRSIGELYRFAHGSFVALARGLTSDDWATPVPCTPGWTVRDVLSHVAGIPDDALAGRMDGAPGEAWTAAQIERNRDATVDELLARWAGQVDAFAVRLDAMGERRPPFDCHSHEHDIRHALAAPGARRNDIVDAANFASIDVPGVRVRVGVVDGRSFVTGGGASEVSVDGLTDFEVFRSRLGRRSRSQVCAYRWTGERVDIDAVVDRWFSFGPSLVDIVEP
jgi:uncharacterized protein (TIGR03083 family)